MKTKQLLQSTFDKELDKAEKEAKRFLKKAEEYREALHYKTQGNYYPYSLAERATVRRASMDLTRSLSRLRQTSIYALSVVK